MDFIKQGVVYSNLSYFSIEFMPYYLAVIEEPQETPTQLKHEERLLREYCRREGFDPEEQMLQGGKK